MTFIQNNSILEIDKIVMISEGIQLESEKKEVLFNEYIEQGINNALILVRQRFEDTVVEKDKLPFHNTVHTKDMWQRAVRIASTINQADPEFFPQRSAKIAELAAIYHDTVQRWVESPVKEGNFEKIMRRRLSGDNEKASAEEFVEFMEQANRNSGIEIFTDTDKAAGKEGIMVTVPGFDLERGTVIQPSLTAESGVIARIVALADLGAAGMDGPGKFLPEGDALFREENLDILNALKKPEDISDEEKDYYRMRMLGWMKLQYKFVSGRKALLEKELMGLPKDTKAAVRKLFDKFDASIEAAEEIANQREKMTFEELAAATGY